MTVTKELEKLLKEEQSALLSGKYEKLTELAHQKAKLMALFKAQPIDRIRSGAAALKLQTQKNEKLLASAAKGFRAGLGKIRSLGQSIEQSTYARDGQKRNLGQLPKSFEKRF